MSRRSRRIERIFPRIVHDGYELRSREDFSYNCIAFAAGDLFQLWDGYGGGTGTYWPDPHQRGCMFKHLIYAYEAVGFRKCNRDTRLEHGFEKVALYMDESGEWTHAARQRQDGWWESKLGEWDDIIHRIPESLTGPEPAYGTIQLVMARSITLSARARYSIRRLAVSEGRLRFGRSIPFER